MQFGLEVEPVLCLLLLAIIEKKKFNSKIFAIINEKKTIKKLFMERTKLIIIVSLSNCKRNYRILLPLGSNGLEAYYKSIATNC